MGANATHKVLKARQDLTVQIAGLGAHNAEASMRSSEEVMGREGLTALKIIVANGDERRRHPPIAAPLVLQREFEGTARGVQIAGVVCTTTDPIFP